MTVATDPVMPLALSLIRQHLLDTVAAPDGRVFWGLANAVKDGPRIIVQPTGPGQAIRYIGQPTGWIGEIAIRAYAPTLEAAEIMLTDSLANLLSRATVPDENGVLWDIAIRSAKPIPSLPGPTVAVCGIAYRIRVSAQ